MKDEGPQKLFFNNDNGVCYDIAYKVHSKPMSLCIFQPRTKLIQKQYFVISSDNWGMS